MLDQAEKLPDPQRTALQTAFARDQLRTAYTMLADMGAGGFAERARIELKPPAGTPAKRGTGTAAVLTPRESQIAGLARVTAPMPGRAASTMPNATDTGPARMNIARVPAPSPLAKAAKNSEKPPVNAQIATMTARTPRRISEVDHDVNTTGSFGVNSRWKRN